MRFRRYLWLFVLALTWHAHAEEIDATPVYRAADYIYTHDLMSGVYTDPDALCDALQKQTNPQEQSGYARTKFSAGGTCRFLPSGDDFYLNYKRIYGCSEGTLQGMECRVYTCPDASWTLSGSKCVKAVSPCESKNGQNGTQTYAYSFTRPEENAGNGDVICVDSCAADVVLAGEGGYSCAFSSVGAGQCVGSHTVQYIYNGQSCSGNTQKTGDTANGKKPPCAAHEGVLTTDDGRVMCLPEGTPKTRKPDVQQKKKTETFPDGSQKETVETRTKDPGTGAEHVNSSSSSTGGQAGPEGEQISDEDISPGTDDGTCTGDDCGEGGGAEFNGPEGDLYEKGDRTIKQAIDDFVSRVKSSGVFAAASNWFTVAGMAGSCGGMSANIPMINETISMDEYICGQSAHVALQIAGIVVLALAAFAGWKIAFL